jgi:hypothetical protein
MQSTTTAAKHRKYVLVDLSRNVYLIVADLLVGAIVVEQTVLLVIVFTKGGEISFWPGVNNCSFRTYVSGVVGLALAPVPPSMTVLNQKHMETPVAQVLTTAQM